MKVETHCTIQAFELLRSEWNVLLHQSATDTVFLTWEFQQTWWTHFATEHRLRLLSVRADDGQLLGIAPLYLERTADGQCLLRLIGGVEVADYLDFIVQRDHESEVYAAIVDALCIYDDWHALDLRNVPAASPLRASLSTVAGQRQFAVTERVEEVCPLIHLPATFTAYLDALDKKQRHEVRRKMRKAHDEATIAWYIIGAEHDFARAVDDFIELQRRSMLNKSQFMTPAMMAFFRDLAQVTFGAGWLELSFIEVNGQRAATYWSFNYQRQTLVYNSGFDPQAYSALSPGIVLLTHLIEHSITQERTVFDFLQGNETYKYRMGAHDSPVYQLQIVRP